MKNLTETGRVRFIAYGEEVCPETGTLHYQMYLCSYDNKKVTGGQLVRWFGEGHMFQTMYGSLKQNEIYCSKEGSFHKLGDEPRQGERHDLIGFKRKLDKGEDPLEIAEEEGHFGTYIKYHGGMEKYAHHIRGKKVRTDRTPPKVYIRIGESGSGKTRWLDEQFGLTGWAFVPAATSSWFITRTVANCDCAVFDDVGPSKIPKIEDVLNWTDRYPIEFNGKCNHFWWKPKAIVFTSNVTWNEWWPNLCDAHKVAFGRRIFRISLVFKDRPEEHFYPNGD